MRLRQAVGWLGGIVRDLNPAGGAAAPPLPGGHGNRFVTWWAQVALIAVAAVLGGVAAGQVADAPDSSVLLAVALGVAQGLPVALAPPRPMAAFWVSVLVGALVSETARAGAPGPVWAEPSLLAHLAVLTVAGLRTRVPVLPVLWLVTLLAGASLVQRMPGLHASPDLMEMSTLSAVVLVAAGALRGRRDALRRLADQERISHAERLHRSVLEERARIARELHDVVAHHMSLIAIQAEAAPYRVADAPPEAMLAPTVTRRLIAEFARLRPTPSPAPPATLTARETEILTLIAAGLSNAEIAARLVIAEQTVKTHIGRILAKLGLRDRTQAAIFAYNTGLVHPGGY